MRSKFLPCLLHNLIVVSRIRIYGYNFKDIAADVIMYLFGNDSCVARMRKIGYKNFFLLLKAVVLALHVLIFSSSFFPP